MTTTAFRIDLMELAIGMKLFTNHRRIPTTIRATRIGSNGIFFCLSMFPLEAVSGGAPAV